jgi:hypothetical protein
MTDNNRKTLDRLLRQLSTGEQKRREAEAG